VTKVRKYLSNLSYSRSLRVTELTSISK